MEQKIITIPFDLETAKKIRKGERLGQIVAEKGRNRAEIVYEDDFCNAYPLLVVIHSISVVMTDWFSVTGESFSSENRLLLEVPEYTTFKDGDVLSNEEGNFAFILSGHGRYSTSLYAYINFQGILYIGDGDIDAANKNNIERFTLATESERQKLVDALKASKEPKAKIYLKRFFGIKEEPKYEFKPFDKVLVRRTNQERWKVHLFSRESVEDNKYECLGGVGFSQCIPYEGNEHLLGTDKNSK